MIPFKLAPFYSDELVAIYFADWWFLRLRLPPHISAKLQYCSYWTTNFDKSCEEIVSFNLLTGSLCCNEEIRDCRNKSWQAKSVKRVFEW